MLTITAALALFATINAALALPQYSDGNVTALLERDPLAPPLPDITVVTNLVGNGNPHQNYYHTQLSEPITCASDAGCSVDDSQTSSFTIGFTIGSGGGPGNWIGGGFSVTKSWTTGNAYTCEGNPGETVCIWYNTAHTAYTVEETGPGIRPADRKPYIIYSPNQDNRGGEYYCVSGPAAKNDCRSKGDNYWDYNGRPGGP